MKNQVTNGFDRMTVNNLLIKANFIISEMTANANYFPTPTPALTEVQTATDDLQAATLAAENRDRVAIAYRNEQKEALIMLLRKLGIYVNLMADGNRTIAMSSGFDVSKEIHPVAPIGFVETPILSLGTNAGELVSKIKTVNGARTYQFLISPDANLPVSQWGIYTSTQAKYVFKGLDSIKRYYIKVAAVGVNNQLVYSDVSSFVTQ